MKAVRLDLEFDKDSWLRAEFQFIRMSGDLVGAGDKQYRFIAKESLETEIEIYNQIMPIITIEGNDDYWNAKVEIYRPLTDIEPSLLHYIIRQENPEPGNEDSDETLIYGIITLDKRI